MRVARWVAALAGLVAGAALLQGCRTRDTPAAVADRVVPMADSVQAEVHDLTRDRPEDRLSLPVLPPSRRLLGGLYL